MLNLHYFINYLKDSFIHRLIARLVCQDVRSFSLDKVIGETCYPNGLCANLVS